MVPFGPGPQGLLNIGFALDVHPEPNVPLLKSFACKYVGHPPSEYKIAESPSQRNMVSEFAVALLSV